MQLQNTKYYFEICVTYAIIDSSSNSIRRLQMLCFVWTSCYLMDMEVLNSCLDQQCHGLCLIQQKYEYMFCSAEDLVWRSVR